MSNWVMQGLTQENRKSKAQKALHHDMSVSEPYQEAPIAPRKNTQILKGQVFLHEVDN